MPFLTKNYVFENFSNFPVEAEKLMFQTKWVVFAPNQFAKFHIRLKYCLTISEILDFALMRYHKRAGTRTSARVFF